METAIKQNLWYGWCTFNYQTRIWDSYPWGCCVSNIPTWQMSPSFRFAKYCISLRLLQQIQISKFNNSIIHHFQDVVNYTRPWNKSWFARFSSRSEPHQTIGLLTNPVFQVVLSRRSDFITKKSVICLTVTVPFGILCLMTFTIIHKFNQKFYDKIGFLYKILSQFICMLPLGN